MGRSGGARGGTTGPYEYLRPLPELPTGLTFNSNTGEIDGTVMTTTVASTPRTGSAHAVATGATTATIQAAIDACEDGDWVEFEAGGSWTLTGPLTLPDHGGSGWCWLTTSGTLPAEGTQMTAALAATHSLPQITAVDDNAAIQTNEVAYGVSKWRIAGLEITCSGTSNFSGSLVYIGLNLVDTVDDLPEDMIVDRCWIHPHEDAEARGGVTLHATRGAVIDSRIEEVHHTGVNSDAQAIRLWQGQGPIKIVNNYLSASHECVAFGGADPSHEELLISDIEFRRNYLFRPTAWRGVWPCKNCYEMKQGQRVLIEANVMENAWKENQAGNALTLWSVNQNGGTEWIDLRDVTIRFNWIKNTGGFAAISSRFSNVSISASRFDVYQNLVTGIGDPTITSDPSDGTTIVNRVFTIGSNATNALSHVRFAHNTVFSPSDGFNVWYQGDASGAPIVGLVVENNLGGVETGGFVFQSAVGNGQAGWALVGAGAGAAWRNNVIVDPDGGTEPNEATNSYPTTVEDTGIATPANATSTSAVISDFELTSGDHIGSATDGTDPGVNTTLLATYLTGVT